MKLTHRILPVLLIAMLTFPALSQPGPGSGPRQGGEFRFNQDNTRGWSLMTSQERTAHRDKMLSSKTYEECKAYQSEHHALMEARAKEKGQTLPSPRANACDNMKARGLLQ